MAVHPAHSYTLFGTVLSLLSGFACQPCQIKLPTLAG
jgi:hypothetical protein